MGTLRKGSEGSYFSNSRIEVASAAWTRGQFPAAQVMGVLAAISLLFVQYAAAEYCSKNDS